MNTPFIRNHQYNFIKKQTDFLLKTLRTVADRRVLETVRYRSSLNVVEAFSTLSDSQQQLLQQISAFETAYDFQKYLSGLEPYLEPFPQITPKQIQKLFPKNKKLKVPDLSAIDFRYMTYLSWIDIATNKLFIVYPFEGQFIGIEGRMTPMNKKGIACSVIGSNSSPSLRSRPGLQNLRRMITPPLANIFALRAKNVIIGLRIQQR